MFQIEIRSTGEVITFPTPSGKSIKIEPLGEMDIVTGEYVYKKERRLVSYFRRIFKRKSLISRTK